MKKNIVILTIMAIMMAAATTMATNTATIEGTFKGALFSYLGKEQPTKLTKAQIAIEPDFVLHDGTGKDHFVANLPRSTKARYLNQQVRVSGAFDEEGIVPLDKLSPLFHHPLMMTTRNLCLDFARVGSFHRQGSKVVALVAYCNPSIT
jgi:hypothetical protein